MSKVEKIMLVCLGILPILFLLMSYNKSTESVIILSVCNLLAIIFAVLGNLSDTLQRNERRTIFLLGTYYSLFSIVFLVIAVSFLLQEHVDKLLITVFMIFTFLCLFANARGVLKYNK